jgi:hypothetical protein
MITGDDRSFKTLDGRIFPFDPTNRQSRADASKAAHEHNAEVIRQREAQAGRNLSLTELMHGVAHKDTRTVAEKIADANPPTNETAPTYSDAVAKHLAYLRANPGYNPDERARTKRSIRYYEEMAANDAAEAEAKAAAQAKIEALKTPKCQDALKHANAVVNDLRFTPTAEQAEVEQAQRRLANLSESADPKGYWQAVRPYLERRDARIQAAVEHKQQEAATLADLAAQIQRSGQIPPDVAQEMAGEMTAEKQSQQ